LWGQEPAPRLFSKDLTRSRCVYNRKVCPYYALCSSDVSAWPSLIDQYYEVREVPKTEKVKKLEGKENG